MGRWGLAINVIAVAWGLFVVINIGWPRAEIYGEGRWGRFAAPLATLIVLVCGALYFLVFQRTRTGILPEHACGHDGSEEWPVAVEDGQVGCGVINSLGT
jgi:hypothetical protein